MEGFCHHGVMRKALVLAGPVVWIVWGAITAAIALEVRDPIVTDVIPVLAIAGLVAWWISRTGLPSIKYGFGALVFAAVALPVIDLVVNPPCRGLGDLRIVHDSQGKVDVRCVHHLDMTGFGIAAGLGFLLIVGLAFLLLRLRRAEKRKVAAETAGL
jgi:hypothetical protein